MFAMPMDNEDTAIRSKQAHFMDWAYSHASEGNERAAE